MDDDDNAVEDWLYAALVVGGNPLPSADQVNSGGQQHIADPSPGLQQLADPSSGFQQQFIDLSSDFQQQFANPLHGLQQQFANPLPAAQQFFAAPIATHQQYLAAPPLVSEASSFPFTHLVNSGNQENFGIAIPGAAPISATQQYIADQSPAFQHNISAPVSVTQHYLADPLPNFQHDISAPTLDAQQYFTDPVSASQQPFAAAMADTQQHFSAPMPAAQQNFAVPMPANGQDLNASSPVSQPPFVAPQPNKGPVTLKSKQTELIDQWETKRNMLGNAVNYFEWPCRVCTKQIFRRVEGRNPDIAAGTVISNHPADTRLTGGMLGCFWIGRPVDFEERFGGNPKVVKCVKCSVQHETGVWMQKDRDTLGPNQEGFVGGFQTKSSNQLKYDSKGVELIKVLWDKYQAAWAVRQDANRFPEAFREVKTAASQLADAGYIEGMASRRKGEIRRSKSSTKSAENKMNDKSDDNGEQDGGDGGNAGTAGIVVAH